MSSIFCIGVRILLSGFSDLKLIRLARSAMVVNNTDDMDDDTSDEPAEESDEDGDLSDSIYVYLVT